jgi:hypothetical protein
MSGASGGEMLPEVVICASDVDRGKRPNTDPSVSSVNCPRYGPDDASIQHASA